MTAPRAWRFGLVGHPVAHSLSPRLFALLNAPGEYALHDVPPAALPGWLSTTGRTLDGFNVTVPHKASVATFCETLHPDARRIGAVNCVRVAPGGALVGGNSDITGFEVALGPAPVHRAVVLGAGGAARAVVEVLLRRGAVSIDLVNRSTARTAGLMDTRTPEERQRLRARPLDELAQAVCDVELVVQCTSAALSEPGAFRTLPWHRTAASARALELVYRPRETAFLRGAVAAGRQAEDGLTMLAAQAVAALAFFTAPEGAPTPIADLAGRSRALAERLRTSVD